MSMINCENCGTMIEQDHMTPCYVCMKMKQSTEKLIISTTTSSGHYIETVRLAKSDEFYRTKYRTTVEQADIIQGVTKIGILQSNTLTSAMRRHAKTVAIFSDAPDNDQL